MKQRMLVNFIIPIVLICFFVIWVLKINGVWDFSHSDHIRNFEVNKDVDSTAFMLDDELNTVWGDTSFWGTDEREVGDYLIIYFDDVRSISSITMIGSCPKYLSFSYQTTDGQWEALDTSLETDGDIYKYGFSSAVDTAVIRMEVSALGQENIWHVGELEVEAN